VAEFCTGAHILLEKLAVPALPVLKIHVNVPLVVSFQHISSIRRRNSEFCTTLQMGVDPTLMLVAKMLSFGLVARSNGPTVKQWLATQRMLFDWMVAAARRLRQA